MRIPTPLKNRYSYVFVIMKISYRINSFDYSFPSESIVNIYEDDNDLIIEFSCFIILLNESESINTTGKDIWTDLCQFGIYFVV